MAGRVTRRAPWLLVPLWPALAASAQAPVAPEGTAVFRVQFSGSPSPDLAREAMGVLREADREYRERLGFGPRGPLTVVLQNGEATAPVALPAWADGLYDGTIQIPTGGAKRLTARLAEVLRHELAHSFIESRTRGNCPAWLQEGLAQWLEGGHPDRADAPLAERARQGALPALLTLEAPFLDREADSLEIAYAASLSATAHILRTRGVAGLRRLLESLGAGLPSEEALPNALGLSYRQLQTSWAGHLSGLATGPPKTGF